MTNKRKKVLFVIVEGNSDSLLFYDLLQRKYSNELVVIKPYRGDILVDYDQTHLSIRDRIRAFFLKHLQSLKLSDFLGIVHLTDTDAAFAGDDKVQIAEEQAEDLLYHVTHLSVKSDKLRNQILVRNKTKKVQTELALEIKEITYKGTKIPYRLYYLSQQLEHVVFNQLNIPQAEKERKVVSFLKRADETTLNGLFVALNPTLPEGVTNNHRASWDFILTNENSLQRYTNAILMYEFVDSLIEKALKTK